MKVLIALSLVLAVVSAIPRPEIQGVQIHNISGLAPHQQELEQNYQDQSNQIQGGDLPTPGPLNSNEDDDDEDDDGHEEVNLDDLLKAIDIIKDFLSKIDNNKPGYNINDWDDIEVPSQRHPEGPGSAEENERIPPHWLPISNQYVDAILNRSIANLINNTGIPQPESQNLGNNTLRPRPESANRSNNTGISQVESENLHNITRIPQSESANQGNNTVVPQSETEYLDNVTRIPQPENANRGNNTGIPQPTSENLDNFTRIPQPESANQGNDTGVLQSESEYLDNVTRIPQPEIANRGNNTGIRQPTSENLDNITRIPQPESASQGNDTDIPHPESVISADRIRVNSVLNRGNEIVLDNEILDIVPENRESSIQTDVLDYITLKPVVPNNNENGSGNEPTEKNRPSENSEPAEDNAVPPQYPPRLPLINNIRPWFLKEAPRVPRPHFPRVPNVPLLH